MLLMCQSRLQKILHPLLQLAVLNPFITGDESRKLFAISLTAEQISQIYFSTSSNEEWVQRPQIEIQPTTGAIVEWKSCKNQSRILWFYGRAGVNERRTLVDRNVSKQEMQWLSISWNHGKKSKRRQPRELKHKIKEANEHKLECKPEQQRSRQDVRYIPPFQLQNLHFPRSAFFASAGVWWRH